LLLSLGDLSKTATPAEAGGGRQRLAMLPVSQRTPLPDLAPQSGGQSRADRQYRSPALRASRLHALFGAHGGRSHWTRRPPLDCDAMIRPPPAASTRARSLLPAFTAPPLAPGAATPGTLSWPRPARRAWPLRTTASPA
jgi:hypothetical protein